MFQPIDSNFCTDIRIVSPSYKMKGFHEHHYHEMFFVIRGDMTLQVKAQLGNQRGNIHLYKMGAGSITIIPAGTPHRTIYLSGKEHERGVIYFDGKELSWIEQELGEENARKLVSGMILQIPERKIAMVKDLMHKICFEHHGIDEMSMACVRSYFHMILLYMLRCNTYQENVIVKMDVENQQIQAVIEYLLSHYAEDVSLGRTAELFHMSQSSLSRKFKAFTGKRFREYLIDIRTGRAAEALRETSQSVTEIAERCGFSDSNTFGDTFRRIYGVCPTEYRKRS